MIYVILSVIFASFGLIVGGALASAKVKDLHDRLAAAEDDLAQQTDVIKGLTSAIKDVMSVVDGRLAHRVGPDSVASIRRALANCDEIVLSREEGASIGAG